MTENRKSALCWARALVAIGACFVALACARPAPAPAPAFTPDPVLEARYQRALAESRAITYCGDIWGSDSGVDPDPASYWACMARFYAGTCGGDAECSAFYGGEY